MKLFCMVNKFLDYIVDCYFKRLLPGLMITDAPLLILVVLLLALVSKTFFSVFFIHSLVKSHSHARSGASHNFNTPQCQKKTNDNTHRTDFCFHPLGKAWLGSAWLDFVRKCHRGDVRMGTRMLAESTTCEWVDDWLDLVVLSVINMSYGTKLVSNLITFVGDKISKKPNEMAHDCVDGRKVENLMRWRYPKFTFDATWLGFVTLRIYRLPLPDMPIHAVVRLNTGRSFKAADSWTGSAGAAHFFPLVAINEKVSTCSGHVRLQRLEECFSCNLIGAELCWR